MSKLLMCVIFCISLFMLLSVVPVYAVDVYKISEYAGGHQIWFEAEAFDSRDPDSENNPGIGFKRVDAETNIDLPDDTFGDALINVQGNDKIWLIYNFDISETGGKAGTWYLRARLINPGNRSEWLWMLGDDGDKIPDVKPVFDKGDDRIFDANLGPPWSWMSRTEGEMKELQDGENAMMVWHREGDTTVMWDVLLWSDNPAYSPTDDDYRNAEEIALNISVEPAGKAAVTWGAIKGGY
ncbi:hypothetical protein ACFL6S_20415 [Candidatus Poribacteria bacterium]